MRIANQIKQSKKTKRTTPLWEGPESDGPQGGVTQSLLGRFLSCRERFRLKVVEGLQANEGFNPRLEYGNMWHVCEEAHAAGDNGVVKPTVLWNSELTYYCKQLCQKYPLDQPKIEHWYSLCKAFFPLYVEHWREHPDVKERTALLQEETFKVPYKLPSGRTVYLRGKWDAVDLIGKGKTAGIYIQENKTKSSIDVTKLTRQLKFDLQTMFYMVAFENHRADQDLLTKIVERGGANLAFWLDHKPSRGVRYNVIRRPAHKSVESALKKFHEDREEGRVGEWFARFRCEISPHDVAKFRRECLDPILEQLCDWWGWVSQGGDCFSLSEAYFADGHSALHWRHPFGIYNPMDEGGFSDVDAYLENGSEVGLQRVDTLFPEL